MKKSKIILLTAIILIFVICFINSHGEVIENLQIPVALGSDIDKNSDNNFYIISYLTNTFKDDTISSNVITSKSKSVIETRENRQLKLAKVSNLGLNRIYVFGEETAKNGLNNFIDVSLNNADVNDRAICVVCKGKAEDILKCNVKGYSNSAEFIEGMVKNLKQYNFFPMQYSFMDMVVRIDAEGRSLLLPYIEITNTGIETTGLAIFKKDKFIGKADMNESRIINILKEDNVKGILTLQNDSKKYINCYTYSKRKAKCYKNNGKYSFEIDLNLKGNIVSNELYKNLYSDKNILNSFEKDMADYVEKMCNESIKKINLKYKIDILDLGKVATAKYGRGTGTDWNEIVCNSPIKINVKFSVDTEGRGNY